MMERLISSWEEYQTVKNALAQGRSRSPVLLTGGVQIHKAQFLAALCRDLEKGAVVVTQDEQSAVRLCEDLNLFLGEPLAVHYPERELTLAEVEGVSREYEQLRLSALSRLAAQPRAVAVASAAAAVQPTIPPDVLRKSITPLGPGQEIGQETLIQKLLWAGYARTQQVEGMCQFAVRGGILDFWTPDCPQPVRVEFWGDEIDTIAAFSPESQRREENLPGVTVTPARELLYTTGELAGLLREHLDGLTPKQRETGGPALERDIARLEEGRDLACADRYFPILYPKGASLLDYLDGRILAVSEGAAVKESLAHSQWMEDEDVKALLEQGGLTRMAGRFSKGYGDLSALFGTKPTVLLDSFPRNYPGLKLGELANLSANVLSVWGGQLEPLLEDLEHYLGEGYCVYIFNGTRRGAAALATDLQRHNIPARYLPEPGEYLPGQVLVCEGSFSSGFEYPGHRLAGITYGRASQGLGRKKNTKARKKNQGKAIQDIADLTPGDYVVHSAHGIGVFEGIVKKEIQGIVKDYIKIKYAGTDTLFVPVTQLDLVTKYIGGREDAGVKLNKLNSDTWNKTRQRVKKAVSDMAKELIQLYAKRLRTKGFAFSPDGDWQREFEERFEYDETEDQLRCAAEIKADMERPSPMDRLLCGDVGFGKTEVALRAVFKCVLDGKQCAVMVPTTILAWQHYQTFLRRLEGYPVTVELLSRFRTPKQQKEILKKLAEGRIDVVVGTHKLVQKDVKFKDLGLCIIDEEQRFGVAHKERFKELRTSVDILTLSATPIPRTLNMAMSGIRDMSVIEEAPQDRHPVQTYVLEYNEPILLEAIRKELRRGGQVFYLHNRVDSIQSCAARLAEKLPGVTIRTAHGRMGEDELSEIWRQLLEREIDVLVCTTIIEAGVDVPNCNTLIIEDADCMGLSQLYQLRGRVGRSTRRAYAYFTFRRGRVLTEVGEKRLAAIREFTAFGSGFRIAMRDLEIRGAGDILGTQQHGQMESVGYDLYLKLLGEAISEEKGEPVQRAGECLVDIQIQAHIPESYIGDLSQRIDIYKKIACVYTQEDYLDTMDELIDRFGEPPAAVAGLLDVALVRNGAAQLGIREITQRGTNLLFFTEAPPSVETIVTLTQGMRGRVMVSGGAKPYFTVRPQKGQKPLDVIREVIGVLGNPLNGDGEVRQ